MSRGFFADKYGWDRFSYFLIIISLILIFTRRGGFILGLPLAIYAVWRVVSRNFQARRRESMIFERYVHTLNFYISKALSRVKALFKKTNNAGSTIISCPRCGQKLRLPKGKGKVIITCQRCSNIFKYKS